MHVHVRNANIPIVYIYTCRCHNWHHVKVQASEQKWQCYSKSLLKQPYPRRRKSNPNFIDYVVSIKCTPTVKHMLSCYLLLYYKHMYLTTSIYGKHMGSGTSVAGQVLAILFIWPHLRSVSYTCINVTMCLCVHSSMNATCTSYNYYGL